MTSTREAQRERDTEVTCCCETWNIDAVAFIYSPTKMTATTVLSNPQINTNYITRDEFLTRSGKGENNKNLQNTETKKKHFFFLLKT